MNDVLARTSVMVAAFLSGCGDSPGEGRATAQRVALTIKQTCGTTENREAGGPRTVTPIDLDGKEGPSGFLVTCVNGRVEYVEASE